MSLDLNKFLIDGTHLNKNVRKMLRPYAEEFNLLSKQYGKDVNLDSPILDIAEIFHLWLNRKPGYCLTCNSPTKFLGLIPQYAKFCNASCQMRNVEQQKTRKEDSISRFGVNSYLQKPDALLKAAKTKSTDEYKRTFNEKVNNFWSSPELKDAAIKKANITKLKNGKSSWLTRYAKLFNKLLQQGFVVEDTFQSGKPKIVKHEECGHSQFYGRWSGEKYLCSHCNPNPRTQKEQAFVQTLESELGIIFEKQVPIGPIKVDALYNNIAIDFNGLFWHSKAAEDAGFGKFDPDYHYKRYLECQSRGIKLIQVFEDEWENKKDIVLNRLKHIFKMGKRIFARQTALSVLDKIEAKKFLLQYHISGNVPCSLAIGLFKDTELIAVMTLGPSRFEKDAVEILRFASKYSVIGGLSKMVKFASNKLKQDIITYSDNFWGNGQGYQAAGFQLIKQVKAGYFYYDKKNFDRVARQAFTKSQFERTFGKQWDELLNEDSNAKTVNCFRVGDAGKNKWVFHYGESL